MKQYTEEEYNKVLIDTAAALQAEKLASLAALDALEAKHDREIAGLEARLNAGAPLKQTADV